MTNNTTNNKNFKTKSNTYVNPLDNTNKKFTILVALTAFLLPFIIQAIASIGSSIYLISTGEFDASKLFSDMNSNFNTTVFFVSECLSVLVVLVLLRKHLRAIFAGLKSFKSIIIILAITTIAILMNDGWQSLCQHVFNIGANENQNIIVGSFDYLPALNFITVAFFAPFLEEVVFRAGIFGLVKKHNKVLAYILSVVLFAMLHFTFSGNMSIELLYLPSYLVCGFLLTYIYDKYGLAGSLLAHTINNLVVSVSIISVL